MTEPVNEAIQKRLEFEAESIEKCVASTNPCCEPSDAERLEWAQNELKEVQETCGRFGRERDMLSEMFADKVFELRITRDNQRIRDRMYEQLRDKLIGIRVLLFGSDNKGKIRMNKEIEKELLKLLRF